MNRVMTHIFLDHPRSVEEGYFEHMRFAAGFAATLFVAAFAATIHALVPCLFEKTASRMIARMHDRLISR